MEVPTERRKGVRSCLPEIGRLERLASSQLALARIAARLRNADHKMEGMKKLSSSKHQCERSPPLIHLLEYLLYEVSRKNFGTHFGVGLGGCPLEGEQIKPLAKAFLANAAVVRQPALIVYSSNIGPIG